MNIFLVGDIHGDFRRVNDWNRFVEEDDVVIQIGDFGAYKGFLEILPPSKCKVYFIDGNHEDFDIINSWSKTEITEVAKNYFYVPRGYVMELAGKRFGFLGGGESVDRYWRVSSGNYKSWWAEERILPEDVDRLVQNAGEKGIDVLISHVPPPDVIAHSFPPINRADWNLPSNWVDISSQMVAQAIEKVKPAKVFCGHMHKSVKYFSFPFEARIIDINEVVEFE